MRWCEPAVITDSYFFTYASAANGFLKSWHLKTSIPAGMVKLVICRVAEVMPVPARSAGANARSGDVVGEPVPHAAKVRARAKAKAKLLRMGPPLCRARTLRRGGAKPKGPGRPRPSASLRARPADLPARSRGSQFDCVAEVAGVRFTVVVDRSSSVTTGRVVKTRARLEDSSSTPSEPRRPFARSRCSATTRRASAGSRPSRPI